MPPKPPGCFARVGAEARTAAGIPIAIGEFDVHYGAMVAASRGHAGQGHRHLHLRLRRGFRGQTGARHPGICGIVKARSCRAIMAWRRDSPRRRHLQVVVEVVCEGDAALHARLTKEAARLKPGQSGLLALDWNNGNRTILVDQTLSGLLLGQTLHTTRAEIYRTLIEATAFGARAIIERFKEYGVPIDRVVCAAALRRRTAAHADLRRRHRMRDARGRLQSGLCAGLAVSAAVLAGAHPDFATAQKAMTSLKPKQYRPEAAAQKTYQELYTLYRKLHDRLAASTKRGSFARDEGPARHQGSPKKVGRDRWARRGGQHGSAPHYRVISRAIASRSSAIPFLHHSPLSHEEPHDP